MRSRPPEVRRRDRGRRTVDVLTAVITVATIAAVAIVTAALATPAPGGSGDGLPSQTLWWLNRATGLVLLVQFTVVLILGMMSTSAGLPLRIPLFITNELHRNLALMTVALLGVHIVTAVLDSFVDIDVWDAFLPYGSPYRPFWLTLGTLATDLLIAVLITTALRRRMSEPAWRLVHITTYLAWLMGVLHGLGIGTDTRSTAVQVTTAVCVLLVVGSAAARISMLEGWSQPARLAALIGLAVVPALIAVWAIQGPLASGWAEKAGTPPPPAAAG